MKKNLKYSLMIAIAGLAIGGAGMYIYFDIKARRRAKIYETPTPAIDAIKSLMDTATPESLAYQTESSVPNAEYTDYQSYGQDYDKYATYGYSVNYNNYGYV